jgi:hypothetical protein
MLTCKQASKLISQSLDHPLTWSEKMRLRLHLFICDPCRHFRRQLNLLRTLLHRMRVSIENDHAIKLPLEVKDRIMHRIESNQT